MKTTKSIRSSFIILTTLAILAVLTATLGWMPQATPVLADKGTVCGTPGSDGPNSSLSGVVNTYYPGVAPETVNAGATSFTLGAARSGGGAAIAAGDLLLVVQMQGADINSNNDQTYGDGGGTTGTQGSSVVYSATLTYPPPGTSPIAYAGGNIASNFSAGTYEYVVATNSVPLTGGTLTISSGLLYSYYEAAYATQGQRTFQVIRVPQYSNATLTGSVYALPWNGTTGGVVTFDVAGTLNWGGQTVSAAGMGFRGGGGQKLYGLGGLTNLDYRVTAPTPLTTTAGADGSKGEGYAGTPRYVNVWSFTNGVPSAPDSYTGGAVTTNQVTTDTGVEGYPNGSYGRGGAGNGGGGSTDGDTAANDDNSGGGGGGNGGFGGMGGWAWNTQIVDGGFGGAPFPGTAPRLIMGGGGGAGTENNQDNNTHAMPPSSGASGGGVVFVRAGTITGTGNVDVHGLTAASAGRDGGGGGGAGGSVVVIAKNNSGNVGTLTVNAAGGKGGDTWDDSAPGTPSETTTGAANNRHGPGGGGAGGFVFTSGAVSGTSSVAGGAHGTSTTDASDFGATAGSAGDLVTNVTAANIPPAISGAECLPVSLTTLKTTSTPTVYQGATATYTITVSNASGSGGASGVSIQDNTLPAGFTYLSTSNIALGGNAVQTSVSSPTVGSSTPTWGTFLIPGGGSVSITFVVQVSSNEPTGKYDNSVTTTYLDPTRTTTTGSLTSTYDGTQSANTGEDVTVIAALQADLAVTKTDGTTSVTSGSTTTYTLTLANNGPSAANGATISDPAVTGLTKTAIGTCTASGGAVCPTVGTGTGQLSIANLEAGTVAVPNLPNGGSISFTVTATISASSGSVTNTFSATPPAGVTDTYSVNNSASDTDIISGTLTCSSSAFTTWSFINSSTTPDTGNGTITFGSVTSGFSAGFGNPVPSLRTYAWPTTLTTGDYIQFAVPTTGQGQIGMS
ncbi:MAG TPA: hypothetical protein VMT91_01800, partial [Anaerolineales bacterium]|nr:hypothetical protein [Anaerolineales bacterium]